MPLETGMGPSVSGRSPARRAGVHPFGISAVPCPPYAVVERALPIPAIPLVPDMLTGGELHARGCRRILVVVMQIIGEMRGTGAVSDPLVPKCVRQRHIAAKVELGRIAIE